MSLRLAVSNPVAACPAWHNRSVGGGEIHAAVCCDCKRDIAVTSNLIGQVCCCTYCGMERDIVPEIEIEPNEDVVTHIVLNDFAPRDDEETP